MVDAATSRGYGGVLLTNGHLTLFGDLWPQEVIDDRIIPIFVLEALAVILGTLTWGSQFHGKKIIVRSDSSNTCGAFNKLKSDNDSLRLLAHFWAQCQESFQIEGLRFHCPGKDNQCADIASRVEAGDVMESLYAELHSYGLDEVTVSYTDTIWRANSISARLLDVLTTMSSDASEARLRAKEHSALNELLPHHATEIIGRNGEEGL